MKKDEFARRRRQLMRTLGKDTVAIVPSAPVRHRNNDVEYFYRQDSDFYYLTGFDEPEAVAVFMPGRSRGEYVLFVRDRDPVREAWDGSRAGPDGAVRRHGADDAFPVTDIDEILPGLLERCSSVHYTMGIHLEFDQRIIGWVNGLRALARLGRHTPQEFVALDHLLHDMRVYKSPAELDVMRRSAAIGVAAHRRAMGFAAPGRWEYEVMAEILHEFHRQRADISYHPIVAGGANACVMHYRANSARLADGDLLLIDAGCEYDYYASDITRTFPVNGRYSSRQRAVYEVVLEAQRAAIDRVRPGNHWNEPHEAAVKAVTQGLVRLGLLKGKVPKLIREEAYKPLFTHRSGHWIGMDVHDVGEYKIGADWRLLEPGMVTTIEPGIYIRPGTKAVAKEWWGIGVRIEDDVVVTRGDPEVLTEGVPTDPDDIESFMRAA